MSGSVVVLAMAGWLNIDRTRSARRDENFVARKRSTVKLADINRRQGNRLNWPRFNPIPPIFLFFESLNGC
jgi:hypothetical protein